MMLDRTDKGWKVYNNNNFRYLNTTQVKEIMIYLKKHKYENVYYDEEDLVIEFKKEVIKIKKYQYIKNRPYINELENKINMFFFRKTISNINFLFNKYNLKLIKVTLSLNLLVNSIILSN